MTDLLTILGVLSRKRLLRISDEFDVVVDRKVSAEKLAAQLAASTAIGVQSLLEHLTGAEWARVCAAADVGPRGRERGYRDKSTREEVISEGLAQRVVASPASPDSPLPETAERRRRRARARLFQAAFEGGRPRPQTRAQCVDGPRPCPWTDCRYHLGPLHKRGKRARETCTLDVAQRDGVTLEVVGNELGLTRERIRQVETKAFKSLKPADRALLGELLEEIPG